MYETKPPDQWRTSVFVTVSMVAKNVSRICDILEPIKIGSYLRCGGVVFDHSRQLRDVLCGLKRFEVFASSVYELRNMQSLIPVHYIYGDSTTARDILLWVMGCASIVNEAVLEVRILLCTNRYREDDNNINKKEVFDELVRWIVSYTMDIAESLSRLGMPVFFIPANNVDPISHATLGRTDRYNFCSITEEAQHIHESVKSWDNFLSKMFASQYVVNIRNLSLN